MDPFDRGRSGTACLSRTSRLGNHRHQPSRTVFRTHGGTHSWPFDRARPQFSGFGALSGPRVLVAAGSLESLSPDRIEWEAAVDRGLRFHWSGTRPSR